VVRITTGITRRAGSAGQHLQAVPPRQVQVEHDQAGARGVGEPAVLAHEPQHLLAVGDHVQRVADLVMLERLADDQRGRPGGDGGRRRRQPGRGQPAGRGLVARGEIHDARREPCSGHRLDQQRVKRVAEPDPVQGIPELARTDHLRHTLACRDDLVQAPGPFKAGDHFHAACGFPPA
jgi:hypothetical protein